MRDYFYQLAAFLDTCVQASEIYTCWLSAESSDFVRFNQGVIRQSGHVRQIVLTLRLIDGQRQSSTAVTLSGNPTDDYSLLKQSIGQLRDMLPVLPEDPHLLIATDVQSSEHVQASQLPESGDIVEQVLAVAAPYDMVGILAAGPVYRGFANSLGQRNWHETSSFNLDWSLYQSKDKAVKTAYAGVAWDADAFTAKFNDAAEKLTLLQRKPVSIAPGAYRAYLAPSALNEIIGMLNWEGLSEKALRTRHSSLRRMRSDGQQLHSSISLIEHTAQGLAPAFQEDGFVKPASVPLITEGKLTASMVSPRTACEYGIDANGANADEAMTAVELAPGGLPAADVLQALDTGMFISNLWYLNFSDRANCRLTGMTRFASFWVENGEIVAPMNVMRFDDSLYKMLGANLLGLTQERELLIDGDTYGERRTGSALLPGALVKDFSFVL